MDLEKVDASQRARERYEDQQCRDLMKGVMQMRLNGLLASKGDNAVPKNRSKKQGR